jgi:hypothetical protein
MQQDTEKKKQIIRDWAEAFPMLTYEPTTQQTDER